MSWSSLQALCIYIYRQCVLCRCSQSVRREGKNKGEKIEEKQRTQGDERDWAIIEKYSGRDSIGLKTDEWGGWSNGWDESIVHPTSYCALFLTV